MSDFLKLYEPINQLKKVDENIWIVDGQEIEMSFKLFKVPFTTRMTIVRLANQKLWLHSPIAFTEELAQQIKQIGEVTYLIAPNKLHYSYMLEWYQRYPQAEVWLAKGVENKLGNNLTMRFSTLVAVAQPD